MGSGSAKIGALQLLRALSSSRVWVPAVDLFHTPGTGKSRMCWLLQESGHSLLWGTRGWLTTKLGQAGAGGLGTSPEQRLETSCILSNSRINGLWSGYLGPQCGCGALGMGLSFPILKFPLWSLERMHSSQQSRRGWHMWHWAKCQGKNRCVGACKDGAGGSGFLDKVRRSNGSSRESASTKRN